MPNGKSTRVIFLEYTEGVTLAESQNKYPSHEYPQYKPLPDESYAEWLHISKEVVSNLHFHPILFSNFLEESVPELQGMSTVAECRVVHRDLKTQNIVITSTSPQQVVNIDFVFSAFRVPEHLIDVIIPDIDQSLCSRIAVVSILKTLNSGRRSIHQVVLMYPSGGNSEY